MALAVVATACGRADLPDSSAPSAQSLSHSQSPAPQGADATATALPDATTVLCPGAAEGFLRARLQGAVDAHIDWSAPSTPQCLGGPRPAADGLRLVYKGAVGTQRLLVIVGVALPRGRETGRNVPASVTVVREGAGQFFATQGDDKCELDEVRLEPATGRSGRYRLTGRGFCMQPARAVHGGEGAVLVTRFDVGALVDYSTDR